MNVQEFVDKSQASVIKIGASENAGDSGDVVIHKAQKDCLKSSDHSVELEESESCDLLSVPFESHEVDINFGDKQCLDSLDGLGGNVDCASQLIEIQTESLEDKSAVGSDLKSESEILDTISDESRLIKGGDNAGEKQLLAERKEIQDASELCRTEDSGKVSVCGPILKDIDDSQKPSEPETEHVSEELSEEVTSKLLLKPNKEDAITVVCENGDFEVDQGLVREETGTQSVGERSINENGNSFNDSALEIQESYQHVDYSKKPFDLYPSSAISEAQIPDFSVPEPETDITESDENDGAITDVRENDHGLGAEEPGSGSVKENEDHSSVISVKHSVLEENESTQHIDDSKTTSSEMLSSCLKPKTDLTERPGQRIENVRDIDVIQGHEVDEEVVEDQFIENIRPENEDLDADTAIILTDRAAQTEDSAGRDTEIISPGKTDRFESKTALSVKVDDISCSNTDSSFEDTHDTKDVKHEDAIAVESVENGHYIAKDMNLEIKSCDSTATASDQSAQIEDSTGGDTNLSSPGEAACLEKKTVTNGHSPNKNIHETEPVLGITDSDREMAAIVVSSFVKPEPERGEKLGQSIQNAPEINVSQRLKVDQEASSSSEEVDGQLLEGLTPEREDTDVLGVDSLENGQDIARDKNLEINSCLRDTTITSIDLVAEFENAAIKGDDFSCTGYINGIVDSERKITAFNGGDVDSENENVIVNVKSNDIPPEASNLHVGIGDLENTKEQFPSEDINATEKLIFQESHDVEKSIVTSAENGPGTGTESLVRPFPFLVKMSKSDDTKLREQVRQAQLLVDEKTQLRDAFQLEIMKYRNNCREHTHRYQAAMDEARTTKTIVKSKRAEIDSLHTVLNKVKNAQTIATLDARILSVEYMIEHETLPLPEEKQFIREIKQLKQLRDQLSSSIDNQDEIHQAINDRDQIEARLKGLRKELDGLKDTVLKAEAVGRAVDKIYMVESKKMKEAQDQYKAADIARQEAYMHMQKLKTEIYEKNQRFRMYRQDGAAAYDHAAKRETEALHNLCFNQVESAMDLWKKDAEFCEEFDGRSLSPDEKPLFSSNGGYDRPENASYEPLPPEEILHQEEVQEEKQVVEVVALLNEDSRNVKEETPLKNTEEAPLKRIQLGNDGSEGSSVILVNEVKEEEDRFPSKEEDRFPSKEEDRFPSKEEECLLSKEEERLPSKEEVKCLPSKEEVERLPSKEEVERLPSKEEVEAEAEAAKKAEELRKEELRLEEKAKALEAIERKKKIAEKAQSRAELRAQKEAEQRDKEREKRLRKKERKKAPDAADNLAGDNTVAVKPEHVVEPMTKEPESKNKSGSKAAQYMKQSKNKSIPPAALRNRGRKKLQQWFLAIGTCLIVILVFVVINVGFFTNLSVNIKKPTFA